MKSLIKELVSFSKEEYTNLEERIPFMTWGQKQRLLTTLRLDKRKNNLINNLKCDTVIEQARARYKIKNLRH